MIPAPLRYGIRIAAVAAVVCSTTLVGNPSAHAAPSAADATAVAAALTAAGTEVTGANWFPSAPPGTPNGIGDSPLGGFPTEGNTFAILTTGDVSVVDHPQSEFVSTANHGLTGTDIGRGDVSRDISVLKVDFTVGDQMNCVRFDFRFFSEEFGLGELQYNDAFVAELDNSTWTASGTTLSTPGNFAFDSPDHPITILTAGSSADTGGTVYSGATGLLTASTPAAPGPHSLYLSLMDMGDELADSAVFVDNLVVGHAIDESHCAPGAKPKQYEVAVTPPTGTHPVGQAHAVTAKVSEVGGDEVSGGTVVFTVAGVNTASGTAVTDDQGEAVFEYTGTVVGDDAITACFDANQNSTCDPDEPFESVVASWTAAPPVAPQEPLAATGVSVTVISVVGALLVAFGALAMVVARRRRSA